MTDTDWLDQLEQKAAAAKTATQGLPWVKDPDDPTKVLASNDGGWDGSLIATIPGDDYGLIEEAVTKHIAAANPHTVHRLINEVRRLSALTDAALGKSAELAAMAGKVTRVGALADEWENTEAYRCDDSSDCPRCVTYQGAVIRLRAALADRSTP